MRNLLWFWVAVLLVVGVGGSVLEWLGPPSDPARSGASTAAAALPAAPVSEPATAVAPPAAPTPMLATPTIPSTPVAAGSSVAQATPALAAADPNEATSGEPASGEAVKSRIPVLVILYAANSDSSRAAAEQLVTRSGVTPDQVEARATADTPSPGVIRFYASEDHAWARRLGQELSGLGYSWRIENLTGRAPKSEHPSVEVWLPDRRRSS